MNPKRPKGAPRAMYPVPMAPLTRFHACPVCRCDITRLLSGTTADRLGAIFDSNRRLVVELVAAKREVERLRQAAPA